jgi:hypothetical protein
VVKDKSYYIDNSDVIIVVFFLIIALLAVSEIVLQNGNKRTITSYTVTDKQVKTDNGRGKYLVYGKDENGKVAVLCVEDSLFRWRWNSSDIFAAIEVGNTYDFTVCGKRINIISMCPNILDYKEVKEWEN